MTSIHLNTSAPSASKNQGCASKSALIQIQFKSQKRFIIITANAALLIIVCIGYIIDRYSHQKLLQQYCLKESIAVNTQQILMTAKINALRADIIITSQLSAIKGTLAGKESERSKLIHELMTISRSKGIYDQIRLLNRRGDEVVRINFEKRIPVPVPVSKLQAKGGRYYFRDSISLAPGKIYFSPLDLNIENGAIEIPFKPMLRLSTTVYNDNQEVNGVVILNYLAEEMLNPLRNASGRQSIKLMVNPDGYWLVNPSPEKEWGFMFENRQEIFLANQWPAEWTLIDRDNEGQFNSPNGLFTFCTLRPLQEGDISSSGSRKAHGVSTNIIQPQNYFWKIISYVPADILQKAHMAQRRLIVIYAGVLYTVLLLLVLARARTRKMQAAIATARQEAHKLLEKKVIERTHELSKANQRLEQEIKQRKESQRIITEREERIRLLFASTAEGIYGLDLNGRCSFCNISCVKLLGYTSEEDLVGREMHPLIHHSTADGTCHPESNCMAWQSFQNAKPAHSCEETLWRADGSNFAAECWAHPIVKENKVIGAVVSFIDISKRKDLETQLVQAQKMEAIGTLAGGISHDFNNILSPIIGYAEMVKENCQTDPGLSEAIDEILFAARRGSDLVRQILTFSRQTPGKKESLDPGPIAREALKLIQVGTPPGISLKTDIPKKLPFITMEATSFHQIIMNLSTNAIHAMEAKGGELQVELRPCRQNQIPSQLTPHPSQDSYLCLSVRDQGAGISPDQLSKIFDPFYTSKPEGKGTGLGLSVVHGIVQSNGGIIDVESQPNLGTQFNIYLPVALEKKRRMKPAPSKTSLPKGHEHVLIVDDWPSILNLEQRRLEILGYKITAVSDPKAAIEKFEANPDGFDIIITDYAMPGMTGIQLSDIIRQLRPLQPVILCTGFLDRPAMTPEIESKFCQILFKPTSKYTLAEAIRATLDNNLIISENSASGQG